MGGGLGGGGDVGTLGRGGGGASPALNETCYNIILDAAAKLLTCYLGIQLCRLKK